MTMPDGADDALRSMPFAHQCAIATVTTADSLEPPPSAPTRPSDLLPSGPYSNRRAFDLRVQALREEDRTKAESAQESEERFEAAFGDIAGKRRGEPPENGS